MNQLHFKYIGLVLALQDSRNDYMPDDVINEMSANINYDFSDVFVAEEQATDFFNNFKNEIQHNTSKILSRFKEEELYHEYLMTKLKLKIRDEILINDQKMTSRRFKIVDESCLSSIQILFRDKIYVNVTLTSSDISVLPCDLDFITYLPYELLSFMQTNGLFTDEVLVYYQVPVEFNITINNLHQYA